LIALIEIDRYNGDSQGAGIRRRQQRLRRDFNCHYDDASDPAGAARNREFNLAKALVSVNKLLAACVKPLRITRFVSHRTCFLINSAAVVALN